MRKGIQLWLIVALVLTMVGCALNQRSGVVRPEEVAAQNDADWRIIKKPLPAQQAGQR